MLQSARSALSALVLAALIGFGALPVPPAPAAEGKKVAEEKKSAEEKQASDEKKARASFEVYKDKSGQYRWRLRSMNKQILATSGEGYKERRDCLAAVESVKRAAAEAPVVDEQPGT
jgi:uncharacterized protein YegP (UPF0339 family)